VTRIADVYSWIDGFAPFSTAEEWDNVGILVGRKETVTDTVLCALDLNRAVIDEALRIGANLIVTHHPVMFRGRKNLREDDYEGEMLCELIRNNIGLIAAHTNFDNAPIGVNDALSEKLGLEDVSACENGMHIGRVKPLTIDRFRETVNEQLGTLTRCYGKNQKVITTVAVLGGAGEDFCLQAKEYGADVYVTGEVSYHKGLDAENMGLAVIEAGHRETELPGVNRMCRLLTNAAAKNGCEVRFIEMNPTPSE